jgi:predicted transcriptional regulator
MNQKAEKNGKKRKTQKDLANTLGLSERTIRNYAKTGKLEEKIEEYLKKRKNEEQGDALEGLGKNIKLLISAFVTEFSKLDKALVDEKKAYLGVQLINALSNFIKAIKE